MRVKERSDYGERLYLARRHAGLKQADLAARVGLAQSTLAELEKSGQGSAKTAKIAQVTGVRTPWLAENDGPMLEDDGDVPQDAQQLASERLAPYADRPEARDYRTITLTLAAAIAESGTQISVPQFVKLIEATYKKLGRRE